MKDESGLTAADPQTIQIGTRVGVAGAFTPFFSFPYIEIANLTWNSVISLKTPIKMFGTSPDLDLISVKDATGGGADILITLVGWLE